MKSGLSRILAGVLCFGSMVSSVHAQDEVLTFEPVFNQLEFSFPVGLRFVNDGVARVFVVEHRGLIKVMDHDTSVTDAQLFLDLSERIQTQPLGELLGLAFHPDYGENGYFFVRYKLENPHRTVLSRFSRSATDPLRADPESEVILLEIETPDNLNNHHGGDLAFGPDGYLYVPMGDGGVQFDEIGNAQSPSSLLGKVLRLDVDQPSEGLNYGIPADNPFVGVPGWREEIYALGLRNPWRLTVDSQTGDVWVGDVGENDWEEINRIEPGQNYGWPVMEGPECLFGGFSCDHTAFTEPVWSYPHEVGVSVTGGYVYRGNGIPELTGKYIFADWAMGDFFSLRLGENDEVEVEMLRDDPFNITTFAEDADGELYVARYFNGTIQKMVSASSSSGEPQEQPQAERTRLEPPYPNPAAGFASVRFAAAAGASVRITLLDVLGRTLLVLFDGQASSNQPQDLQLDVRALADGVYVVWMQADEHTAAQMLVVVR